MLAVDRRRDDEPQWRLRQNVALGQHHSELPLLGSGNALEVRQVKCPSARTELTEAAVEESRELLGGHSNEMFELRARAVQSARERVLPCSRLASDEHVGSGPQSKPAQGGPEVSHRRGLAEQLRTRSRSEGLCIGFGRRG